MKNWCTTTEQWVANLRPHWKVAVYSNLTACKDTVTAWRTAIRAWTWKWAKWTPIWAIRTPSVQNVWKVGNFLFFIGKVYYSFFIISNWEFWGGPQKRMFLLPRGRISGLRHVLSVLSNSDVRPLRRRLQTLSKERHDVEIKIDFANLPFCDWIGL